MEPILSAVDIVITRTIAKFGQSSYQIANIGSVFLKREQPAYTENSLTATAAFFFIASIVLLVSDFYFLSVLTALAFVGSLATLLFWPPIEILTIWFKTSSGDVEALVTQDADLASRIKAAIETAFSQRL